MPISHRITISKELYPKNPREKENHCTIITFNDKIKGDISFASKEEAVISVNSNSNIPQLIYYTNNDRITLSVEPKEGNEPVGLIIKNEDTKESIHNPESRELLEFECFLNNEVYELLYLTYSKDNVIAIVDESGFFGKKISENNMLDYIPIEIQPEIKDKTVDDFEEEKIIYQPNLVLTSPPKEQPEEVVEDIEILEEELNVEFIKIPRKNYENLANSVKEALELVHQQKNTIEGQQAEIQELKHQVQEILEGLTAA